MDGSNAGVSAGDVEIVGSPGAANALGGTANIPTTSATASVTPHSRDDRPTRNRLRLIMIAPRAKWSAARVGPRGDRCFTLSCRARPVLLEDRRVDPGIGID